MKMALGMGLGLGPGDFVLDTVFRLSVLFTSYRCIIWRRPICGTASINRGFGRTAADRHCQCCGRGLYQEAP